MSYVRTTWLTGDLITAAKLNNFEADIQAVSDGTNARGNWSHVETKVLAADAATVTFSGLNGNADGVYLLRMIARYQGINPDQTVFQVLMNNDTTMANYGRTYILRDQNALTSSFDNKPFQFGCLAADTSINKIFADLLIYAKVGNENIAVATTRAAHFTASTQVAAANGGEGYYSGASGWRNNVDNLTSIVIRTIKESDSSAVTKILIDSVFRLYKILNKDR